jgi:hypothetical protein
VLVGEVNSSPKGRPATPVLMIYIRQRKSQALNRQVKAWDWPG